MELKASPTARPRGTVIEAQVEAGRGRLLRNRADGHVKIGDPSSAATTAEVKSLSTTWKPVKQVGPSTPGRSGFIGLPNAGDEFLVMESERTMKQRSDERLEQNEMNKLFVPQRATLETLLDTAGGRKVLRDLLKADTQVPSKHCQRV